MAHGRTNAFDQTDCRVMQMLADFASIGVQLIQKQNILMKQAHLAGAAEMADHLAHRVNNPLQSLTNILYLAAQRRNGNNAKLFAQQASVQVERLSSIVSDLLTIPIRKSNRLLNFPPREVDPIKHTPKSFGNIGRS